MSVLICVLCLISIQLVIYGCVVLFSAVLRGSLLMNCMIVCDCCVCRQLINMDYYYYYFFYPGIQFLGNEKITLCSAKKYKNQAGMNLTPPPPPPQNSHVPIIIIIILRLPYLCLACDAGLPACVCK